MESKAGLGIGGLVASVITGKNVGAQSSAVIVARHSVQLYPMSKMRRKSVVLEAGRHHNCKNTSSRSGSRERMGGTRRDYVISGITLLRSVQGWSCGCLSSCWRWLVMLASLHPEGREPSGCDILALCLETSMSNRGSLDAGNERKARGPRNCRIRTSVWHRTFPLSDPVDASSIRQQ